MKPKPLSDILKDSMPSLQFIQITQTICNTVTDTPTNINLITTLLKTSGLKILRSSSALNASLLLPSNKRHRNHPNGRNQTTKTRKVNIQKIEIKKITRSDSVIEERKETKETKETKENKSKPRVLAVRLPSSAGVLSISTDQMEKQGNVHESGLDLSAITIGKKMYIFMCLNINTFFLSILYISIFNIFIIFFRSFYKAVANCGEVAYLNMKEEMKIPTMFKIHQPQARIPFHLLLK